MDSGRVLGSKALVRRSVPNDSQMERAPLIGTAAEKECQNLMLRFHVARPPMDTPARAQRFGSTSSWVRAHRSAARGKPPPARSQRGLVNRLPKIPATSRLLDSGDGGSCAVGHTTAIESLS